ncbi:MAG: hypothetical protein ACFFCS_10385 [Candidatus Hodarchaeota archaeon]
MRGNERAFITRNVQWFIEATTKEQDQTCCIENTRDVNQNEN